MKVFLRLSEGIVRVSEGIVRVSEGIVRVSEGIARVSEGIVRVSEGIVRVLCPKKVDRFFQDIFNLLLPVCIRTRHSYS
jgi:uncharacterized protein YjeT (DUF2065 family)